MRQMPFDSDSEKGVLGSMLLDPEVACSRVFSLKAEDFYHKEHALLFSELMNMYSDNFTMDTLTIATYLDDNSNLDKIGGKKYLYDLMDHCLVASHCADYRDTVIEKSRLRREISILESALDSTYKGESKSDEVISNLSLSNMEQNENIPLDVLGEKFIQDCIDGKVGKFDWWCPEWTSTLGRMNSELMLLHAPRSTGKTALMLQWILNSHAGSKRTPLASIEMLKPELLPRLIANMGQVNTYTMRVRGHVTENEISRSREAVEQIKALELCIRDKAMSIDDIRAWAISEARNGVDAIFIDNLLSINDGGKQYQSKTIMYDYFIRRLRDLRDELKIPIIILAHPNENMQIAWSRDVENFADVILFLINALPEGIEVNGNVIYKDHEINGQHVIAKFQKNRQGLSPVASLSFEKETQTFKHVRWED